MIENIGSRPAGSLSREHPLINLAEETLSRLGIQPNLTIGSTDANIPLDLGFPVICIGLTRGNGAHTTGEYVYKEPLRDGLEQLVVLTERCFDDLPERSDGDAQQTR